MMVYLLKIIIYPLSILPLPLLYLKGKFWRLVLQYVVRYRKKVVEKNIADSFPHLTEIERKKIVSGFYLYLSELVAEAIKSFTMSEANAARRMKIMNPELPDSIYAQGKSIVLVFGHFNNWEWPGLGSRSQIKHHPASIYKPVKNKAMNSWILQNRERFGNILMSMQETRTFYDNHPKQLTINAFISDQNPRDPKTAHWVSFLGRPTAFLTGAARFAKDYDMPVVFADIQQRKKGYYEATLHLITDKPKEVSEAFIIEEYVQKLEKQIIDHPSRWLWSHKRWKHSQPIGNN